MDEEEEEGHEVTAYTCKDHPTLHCHSNHQVVVAAVGPNNRRQ